MGSRPVGPAYDPPRFRAYGSPRDFHSCYRRRRPHDAVGPVFHDAGLDLCAVSGKNKTRDLRDLVRRDCRAFEVCYLSARIGAYGPVALSTRPPVPPQLGTSGLRRCRLFRGRQSTSGVVLAE